MKRVLGVAVALLASSTMVSTASAGQLDPTGDIRFNVPIMMDGTAAPVLDAISVELFDSGGSDVWSDFCGSESRYGASGIITGANFDCVVPLDTYTIGLSGLPAGFSVTESRCEDLGAQVDEAFANPEATFTIGQNGFSSVISESPSTPTSISTRSS
jgi:hypothetical protein